MIIELTGIPGAGKSTVIEKLKNTLQSRGLVFDLQAYVLERSLLPVRGKTAYELLLYKHIFLLKSTDWKLLKNLFSVVSSSNNSLFHKINIVRNTLKKLIIYRYLKDREEIFLIDEGVTHIPFTAFVDVGKKISGEKVERFLRGIPPVDHLLVVDAPDDLLLERVVARGAKGHRRINFTSKEDIAEFMQQSRRVLEYMKKYFDASIYQNTEREIDTDEIIKILGLKNV
ncbi:MAG: hypothetical protein BV458_04625 [Thermoplasmata archaeon M9B2D]|nr:MAG: hypothetical protein BV458_04625 [Thermoplasmata archaeon M9B2D]